MKVQKLHSISVICGILFFLCYMFISVVGVIYGTSNDLLTCAWYFLPCLTMLLLFFVVGAPVWLSFIIAHRINIILNKEKGV